MTCSHLAEAGTREPQSIPGCPQCIADGFTDWVHLRMCLDCGNVGCCDSSPRKHARVHFEKEGHPVMRSAQPGESWRWCYVDEVVG